MLLEVEKVVSQKNLSIQKDGLAKLKYNPVCFISDFSSHLCNWTSGRRATDIRQEVRDYFVQKSEISLNLLILDKIQVYS
jgi:hypothetical protein